MNREPRVRYKLVSEAGFAMEATNFETTCVPAKRSSVEDQLERSISAVCWAGGAGEQVPGLGPRTDWSLMAGCRKCRDVWLSTLGHSWLSEGQTSSSTVRLASWFGMDDPCRIRRAARDGRSPSWERRWEGWLWDSALWIFGCSSAM
jgi:hypothetical protein